MKLFYVIFVKDEILGSYLNAIRYLSNPNEKHNAHITVRGPYKVQIDVSRYNKIINNEIISIKEVGTFFEGEQNTVFLRCESEKLEEVWQKPDYGYNPHITLYDGKSKNFARDLVKILNSHLINFSFKADKLSLLQSIKGQSDYRLSLEANLKYIGAIIEKSLSHTLVEKMTEEQRLELIDKITDHLSFIKSKKKLSVTLSESEADTHNYDLKVLRETPVNVSLSELINSNRISLNILRDH